MKIKITDTGVLAKHKVISGETDDIAYHGVLYGKDCEVEVLPTFSEGNLDISIFEVIKGDISKIKVGDILTDTKD